jgi:hypothetical protein
MQQISSEIFRGLPWHFNIDDLNIYITLREGEVSSEQLQALKKIHSPSLEVWEPDKAIFGLSGEKTLARLTCNLTTLLDEPCEVLRESITQSASRQANAILPELINLPWIETTQQPETLRRLIWGFESDKSLAFFGSGLSEKQRDAVFKGLALGMLRGDGIYGCEIITIPLSHGLLPNQQKQLNLLINQQQSTAQVGNNTPL